MPTTTPRRRSRAEQADANRRALLAAAGTVFRRLGYSGASVEAIADEAGLSKGAVYSQFESKADLFLCLLEARIEERANLQDDLVRGSADPVADFARRVTEISRQDPDWRLAVLEFRVVAARDPRLNERYAAAHQRTVDRLTAPLRALFELQGTPPPQPLDILATAILAFDTGGFLEDVASPGRLSDDDAVAASTRLLGLRLLADAPPDGGRA